MQQALDAAGFDAGAADGIAGPRTEAAIRAAEARLCLPSSGEPTPELVRRLRAIAAGGTRPGDGAAACPAPAGAGDGAAGGTGSSAPSAAPATEAAQGAPASPAPPSPAPASPAAGAAEAAPPPSVEDVQRALNGAGFDAGAADGILGRQTDAAIRAAEERFGLPLTGEPSPALLDRLGLGAGTPR